MKIKYYFLLLAGFIVIGTAAQNKPENQPVNKNWHKASPSSSVYGIDLQGAKDLVKGRKIKKSPIVAIIHSGVDIEHEALKKSIWINPKEKRNGKDDNKNGYVDDLHGWNFIGGKNGEVMSNTLTSADREWIRLKESYGDVFFDGKNRFRYKEGKRSYLAPDEDMSEFDYFNVIRTSEESQLAEKHTSVIVADMVKEYTLKADSAIMKSFSGKKRDELKMGDVSDILRDVDIREDSLKIISHSVILLYMDLLGQVSTPRTWQDAYVNFTEKQKPFTQKRFDEIYNTTNLKERETIVGDNPLDIKDTRYGNNMLLTNSSNASTLYAGIIAGSNPDENFEGIIPEAKIMPLVVNAAKGDPLIKDVVLAIRYAVDNGADVILLSQQSLFYSPTSKEWMYDALQYAEKKGVLVIVPVWEASTDMSKRKYFPSADMFPNAPLNNLMTVGCSDENGIPSKITNFGKEELDVFAPGKSIYSTLPGDLYATVNSSGLGAAVTAGAAAFIKAYFPKIKAKELRTILVNNVTDLRDKEVELQVKVDDKKTNELYIYEQLCRSGGIINLKSTIETIIHKK